MKRTRLVARRTELNMTQDQVAQEVGIDRSSYVRYETGLRTPSLDVAQRIAVVLRSSVDYLFGDSVAERNDACHEQAVPLDAANAG